MNSAANPASNIPVLTEVIALDDTVAKPKLPEAPAAPAPAAAPAEGTGSLRLSDADREQLERTLQESVLRQLLTRVDFVLEHRVRDGLADVLQTSVEDLARDIRSGLAISLEEMVRRTITQEISKIQSSGPAKAP